MKHLLFVCGLLLGAAACQPEEQVVPVPPAPTDTSKTSSPLNLLFRVSIPNRPEGSLNSRTLLCHNGNLIQTVGKITCFDGQTGSVKWQWADADGDCNTTGSFRLSGDYIVACYKHRNVVVINALTGTTVWKSEISDNSVPRLNAFDSFVYYSHEQHEGDTAYFVRSPLTHLAWDTLAVIGTSIEGAKPMLEPANRWVSASGDTLVYFQNRTYYNNGVNLFTELYCLNLRTREIVWKKVNFTDGNSSSVRMQYFYQNRLYFLGLGDIVCMNPETGEVLWQRGVNQDGVPENLVSTEVVFHDGKLAFAPGNTILHCWDAATGKTVWKNPTAGQGFDMYTWDNKILYVGGIFDFSTGKSLISNDFIWGNQRIIDSVNNRIYTSAGAEVLGYKCSL